MRIGGGIVTAGFVYVAREESGRVLYVGTTTDIKARLATHARKAPWWNSKSHVDVLELDSAARAAAAENDLICELDPPYNIRGGHGALGHDCAGRRCVRLRAGAARCGATRRGRIIRQNRRRCAPPLAEWDAVRSADDPTLNAKRVGMWPSEKGPEERPEDARLEEARPEEARAKVTRPKATRPKATRPKGTRPERIRPEEAAGRGLAGRSLCRQLGFRTIR
jgi:GIY-YIG catalytic domain